MSAVGASTDVEPARLPCPDWCCGGDHESLFDDDGEPEHFGLVANGVGWSVEIHQSVFGGSRWVVVNSGDFGGLNILAERARSFGAALTRAADLIEMDGV